MTGWVFSPKAKRSIRQANKRLNVWHGAVRSGKTVCSIVAWLLFIRHLNAHGIDGDLLMVGKTERTLKRNILEPVRQIVGAKNFRLNRAEGELFLYGRKVYIASGNDERSSDKIQGMTLVGAYGDEVTLWPESFFDMLLTRLSLAGSRLFLTMNPGGPYHWFKVRFLDREDELDMAIWHFTLEDNPALDPAYVESLTRLYAAGSMFYKRFVLGIWVAAEGAVYGFFEEALHRLKMEPEEQPDHIDLAADYGTTNPLSVGVFPGWQRPLNSGLRVYLRELLYFDSRIELQQLTDSEYADLIDKRFKDYKRAHRNFVVDPSAASFILELKKRGWRVKPARNDVVDGIKTQAKRLKSGEYAIGPDDSTQQAVSDYSAYLWDAKAQERGKDEPLKRDDHTKDMERYLLHTLYQKDLTIRTVPKPTGF